LPDRVGLPRENRWGYFIWDCHIRVALIARNTILRETGSKINKGLPKLP